MATYLTIMVGSRPDRARPVVASSDAAVVRAALRAIWGRVGGAALLEGVECEEGDAERVPSGEADERDR